NPTTIKAAIRLVIALLLIVGIQLRRTEPKNLAFGVYLALETILTFKAGKKQVALEKKVEAIRDV
ncbi:MAG: hypothetical protein IPI57_16440, partial [Candidatus Competibacteraceae bacterium]|nr:hypothetical protein [Candidatus Competibacteraceae bacterium]